jgi:hypothetical protein
MAPYVSARYAPPNPMMQQPLGAPKRVIATDDNGTEWWLTDDSQVGDWLEYVAKGGTIEPYGAAEPQPAEPPA